MEDQTNAFAGLSAAQQNKFCQYWPTVKEVLGIIRSLIPADNIRKAIDEIIKWGDKAYQLGCNTGQ